MGSGKIFIIGFNKCGTRSLHSFFKKNGVRSLHVGNEWREVSEIIEKNIANDAKLLAPLCGRYDVFSDSFPISKNFKRLKADYPDSYFILNTRNINNWVVSRLNHGNYKKGRLYPNGKYCEFLNDIRGLNRTWEEWVEVWVDDWKSHHRAVCKYFDNYNRFAIFDIERDNISKIANLIKDEYSLDCNVWGQRGKTKDRKKFFICLKDGVFKKVREPRFEDAKI